MNEWDVAVVHAWIDNRVFRLREFLRKRVSPRTSSGQRFVAIEERSWLTDLAFSQQFVAAIQHAKWNRDDSELPPIHWKGVLNMKDPFSLAAYPLLLWELKPRTIIEIGAYHGGSACWLADQQEAMGIDGRVISYDIDLGRIQVKHPRVDFRRADARDLATFDVEELRSRPHPWLLIEDAHQNVFEVLRYFDAMLREGDYVIVEDTVNWRKHQHLKRFLRETGAHYRVDTRYTDLFGYNATWNRNGYLRRMT